MRALIPALALMFAFDASAAETLDDKLHTIDIDLGNVENRLRLLEREIANPVAQSRFYSLEKRLIDARVYFDLKNYAKAAILYMDAVSNTQFEGHPERTETLFRLGYSLYKLRNYIAAREYLSAVVDGAGGPRYGQALRYLIEIGLETRNALGLEAAVARAGRQSSRTPDAQYAYAKGLFRLGQTAKSLAEFGRLNSGSRQYIASQYYLGVALTEKKQWKPALAAFARVLALDATTKKDKQIRELAHLATGRLHLELGDFTQAINAYQEIGRHSEHFHTALYEMTWAYVNSEKFEKALNTLEVLLLTVEDDHLKTQANILRGRLNIQLDQTDMAVETYEEIVEQFSPIKDEFNRFAKRHTNLAEYFRWLLRRHADAFQVGAVLSERASKWLENDDQLGEVVGLFDDMSYQRKDVREAEQILRDLEKALKSGNRVEIFPNLKLAWTRIIVTENELLKLSQRILDASGSLAQRQMSPAEKARLVELLQRRRALEKKFAEAPKTAHQFQQRKQSVSRRYSALKKESYALRKSLEQARDELKAMEKWLNKARYDAKVNPKKKLDKEQEAKLVTLLETEKTRLRRLHQELESLDTRIAQDKASVGVGDFVSQGENQLRKELLDAHREEEILLTGVLGRLAGSDKARGDRLTRQRGRVVDDFKRLGGLLGRINAAVDLKVDDYRGQLRAERKLLKDYRRQVEGFDRDSDRIAREIGVPLFKEAHKRLTDVVLEADLGLVDVAWKRKSAESEKIQALQKEQSGQLKNLQQTMKEILKD